MKKIYLPIDVKKELPNKGNESYYVIMEGNPYIQSIYLVINDKGERIWWFTAPSDGEEIDVTDSVTHWLKLSTDHFVFTEEKLRELLFEVFGEGVLHGANENHLDNDYVQDKINQLKQTI